jgi:hypothetical protein
VLKVCSESDLIALTLLLLLLMFLLLILLLLLYAVESSKENVSCRRGRGKCSGNRC